MCSKAWNLLGVLDGAINGPSSTVVPASSPADYRGPKEYVSRKTNFETAQTVNNSFHAIALRRTHSVVQALIFLLSRRSNLILSKAQGSLSVISAERVLPTSKSEGTNAQHVFHAIP